MRLGIVGSRDFNDYDFVVKHIEQFLSDTQEKITMIVSGGAKGVDSLAKQYALKNKIPLKEYFPDWKKYGKSAGPIRNTEIINNTDFILAFPSINGKGTQDVMKRGGNKVKAIYIPISD